MRKKSSRNSRLFGRGSYRLSNNSPIPSSKIEVNSDFIALLSAATQTKPEKTVSDLYFYFLGEYKKFNPNSILFKRPNPDQKDTDNHRHFSFLYKVFGFKITLTATILVTDNRRMIGSSDDATKNLTIIFTQGDENNRSKNYRKTFDIKYLEDKMFSEQLFG